MSNTVIIRSRLFPQWNRPQWAVKALELHPRMQSYSSDFSVCWCLIIAVLTCCFCPLFQSSSSSVSASFEGLNPPRTMLAHYSVDVWPSVRFFASFPLYFCFLYESNLCEFVQNAGNVWLFRCGGLLFVFPAALQFVRFSASVEAIRIPTVLTRL